MQILMKQQGRTIALCMAAAVVFGIFFHIRVDGKTGWFAVAYAKAMERAEQEEASLDADADAGVYQTVAARRRPEIVFVCQKIAPQKAVNLHAMFTAKDADGNPAEVEILDVYDASGGSVLYRSNEERAKKTGAYHTTGVVFPAVGVYALKVRATDAQKKTSCRIYKIPVTGS